jgi:glycine dehydrogenase
MATRDAHDRFQDRHIGPSAAERTRMLATIGVPSLDALIDEIIPADIRLGTEPRLGPGETEAGYLRRLRGIAAKNRLCRSYIGMGYHDTITPAVIQRVPARDAEISAPPFSSVDPK